MELSNTTAVEHRNEMTDATIELNNKRLYFSDGTMEDFSDSSDIEPDFDMVDQTIKDRINESDMPLGPRLKYRASKVGDTILTAIDYIGNGIASFLGITTQQYAAELECYRQSVADHNANSETMNNSNWHNPDAGSSYNDHVITKAPERKTDDQLI